MDIVTIGEVLIDLTQTGKDARGIPQFAANPGGAPANLAVAASRLGAQTAFIGKVGADAFGRYLKEVLAENKVDVSGMAVDADHPTTMAVVSVDATGERDFSFYRSANADVMLSKEDISDEALKAAKIVHFGSVSLTADPSRTATLDAAARAGVRQERCALFGLHDCLRYHEKRGTQRTGGEIHRSNVLRRSTGHGRRHGGNCVYRTRMPQSVDS